jgi:hypothetical protein
VPVLADVARLGNSATGKVCATGSEKRGLDQLADLAEGVDRANGFPAAEPRSFRGTALSDLGEIIDPAMSAASSPRSTASNASASVARRWRSSSVYADGFCWTSPS